jgi:hypothetical protein
MAIVKGKDLGVYASGDGCCIQRTKFVNFFHKKR